MRLIIFVASLVWSCAALAQSNPGQIAVPNGDTIVGNSSGRGAAVVISGDASLANTGALTVSKIGGHAVSLAGGFTLTGPYSFTGTLTGTTNVAFPTSGTLLSSTTVGVTPYQERLAVLSPDVLHALSYSQAGGTAVLTVDSGDYPCLGSDSACAMSGSNVTWYAANAGFSLDTNDVVIANYTH